MGEPSTSRWREGSESWGKMSTVVRPNYGTKGTDNITDLTELEGLLSPFQVEKLTYFFNQFFDFNEDGKIDAADFAGLNERLRKVAGWGEEDQEYINMVDNNRVLRRGVGMRLLPPARWSSTLSPSPPGCTCGRGCARAALVLMTSPSGFNLSQGDLQ